MTFEYVPDLESTQVKVALASAAYKNDAVRVVDEDLTGFTHMVASRQGLYVANEHAWKLIVHGFFYGVTFRGDEMFVFECCDLPRGPTRLGRIVKFTIRAERIVGWEVMAKGLDNGCHAIDFVQDRLLVTDTYNQAILQFSPGERQWEVVRPLPVSATGRWVGTDLEYRHVNSVLGVGERILLLLHNGATHTGRQSEIAVFDREWREVERWRVKGRGCHSLAVLGDGTVLTCGTMEGRVVSADGGVKLRVSPYITRGLAVGEDSVVVGASQLAEREGRLRNSGTVTFMDRDYTVRTVLEVPGAPTEIRRLDGKDLGLSSYLAGLGWDINLRAGKQV